MTAIRFPTLFAALLLSGAAFPLFADSTIDPARKFSWSANGGWVSFRHDQPASPNGVVFGEYFLSGHAYAANFGWVDFGDGIPANGIRYLNNSASDCGVNHDGSGNLGGFAYGANIGWINFGWAASTNPARPRVDLLTGRFSGFVYSANLGWINLGAADLVTTRMTVTDVDGDGMADAWERLHFANLSAATTSSDSDHDGAADTDEYMSGTNPLDATDHLRILSSIYNSTMTGADVMFTTSPTRLYRLQTSGALGLAPDTWVDSGLGIFTPDTGASTTRTISWPPSPRKFIRVAVVRPLLP